MMRLGRRASHDSAPTHDAVVKFHEPLRAACYRGDAHLSLATQAGGGRLCVRR
jgi:hypothetical protein